MMVKIQNLAILTNTEKDDLIKSVVLSLDKTHYYWHIPGNVPSSKNSKRAYRKGGFCSIRDDDLTMEYKKNTAEEYYQCGLDFRLKTERRPAPLEVGFFFINGTNAAFDVINKAQVVQDLMVRHGWLDDDNVRELLPYFPVINGVAYAVSKDYTGVIIMVRK